MCILMKIVTFYYSYFFFLSHFVVLLFSSVTRFEHTLLRFLFHLVLLLWKSYSCLWLSILSGNPFVRQLRIPFTVGNKIGPYKLFFFLRTRASSLSLFLRFYLLSFWFIHFDFSSTVFPVLPVLSLTYCFRLAIINNNYSNSSSRNV